MRKTTQLFRLRLKFSFLIIFLQVFLFLDFFVLFFIVWFVNKMKFAIALYYKYQLNLKI